MHIAIFLDQHPESIGGVQTSVRLQKKFLEASGHRVTLISAAWNSPIRTPPRADVIEIPSLPITLDGEFSIARYDRFARQQLQRRLDALPPIDIVHVQADYTIAILGHWFARQQRLPIVHSFHTWLETTHAKAIPFPALAARLLGNIQATLLQLDHTSRARSTIDYLRNFAESADHRCAPSSHFAQTLAAHQVTKRVHVIPTGIDDDALQNTLHSTPKSPHQIPTICWVGRLAPEKRILEFIESLAGLSTPVRTEIYGSGQLFGAALRLIQKLNLDDRVFLMGKHSHRHTLRAIAQADALIQSSAGIETQGMTAYEAASLGTPIIVSDPRIAHEIVGTQAHPQVYIAADSEIDSLAQIIDQFLIQRNHNPQPKRPYLELNQSQLTDRMIDIYRSLIPQLQTT